MSLNLYEDNNIIKLINSYPLYIHDDILLDCENDKVYNKLDYLINNNIPINYGTCYANYPIETMDLLIQLSKLIGSKDAYEILMNIPLREYKLYNIDDKIIKENNYNVIQLLNYNYVWTIILINNNINIDIIKNILNKLVDFYFLELITMNKMMNDQYLAYQNVINSIDITQENKHKYYKLTKVKIPHNIAYYLCNINNIDIDKIIEVAKLGFYNVINLVEANNFNENQIDFLRFSKLGFDTLENFNICKQKIFNNAITEILLSISDFRYISNNYIDIETLI